MKLTNGKILSQEYLDGILLYVAQNVPSRQIAPLLGLTASQYKNELKINLDFAAEVAKVQAVNAALCLQRLQGLQKNADSDNVRLRAIEIELTKVHGYNGKQDFMIDEKMEDDSEKGGTFIFKLAEGKGVVNASDQQD